MKEDRGAFWIFVALMAVIVLMIGYQGLGWLQYGYWTPMPISSAVAYLGWRYPHVEWVGVQRIIDWLMDLPLWVVPGFLAFGAHSEWERSKPI